jgi:hypothetical protein
MRYYIFIALIFFSSCGIYRQNVVNVPLMQQKGQAQISGHIGLTGYDCQAAYALTKHVGFIANYSDLGTKRENYSSTNYSILKHNFGEIGCGYYNKNTNSWISEFFLVAGKGITSGSGAGGDNIPGHTPPYTYFNSANYNRFLIQADFGKSTGKLEYSFSPRVFVINYYNISNSQNDSYKHLPNTFIWTDYALTLRYNPIKSIKISGQIGLTLPITGYKAVFYEASPFNCSIGLIANMNFFKST